MIEQMQYCNAASRRVWRPIPLVAALALTLTLFLLTVGAVTATAQTYRVLYTFQNSGPNGDAPLAGLLRDSSGNLYGLTTEGGDTSLSACNHYGCGTLFKLTPSGQYSVLHTFTGGADGWPLETWGSLIADSLGNMYGVSAINGIYGNGVLFQMTPSGTFTIRHSFASYPTDGTGPQFTLYRDPRTFAVELYGTTFGGGAYGDGTVFLQGGSSFESDRILHSFNKTDGFGPQAGLTPDAAGNLYGTAGQGGSSNCGVVFKLSPSGQYTVLYNFACAPDGNLPGPVVLDAQGNIYGGTWTGGDIHAPGCFPAGCGILYKLTPSGQYTILHTFHFTEGAVPNQMLLDANGILWGTTSHGGSNYGVIFKLDPNDQTYTVVYTFDGEANGGTPYDGLIEDSQGNFYGTTNSGGNTGCGHNQWDCGVIFEFTPAQ